MGVKLLSAHLNSNAAELPRYLVCAYLSPGEPLFGALFGVIGRFNRPIVSNVLAMYWRIYRTGEESR